MAYKTEWHFFKGKGKWVRVHSPDPWGNYKLDLYPDTESYDKLLELQKKGMKNTIKKDEDGYFITFRRPTQKVYKGKVVGFAPPEVLEADGKTTLRDVLVGNGSDLTVKVEAYPYKSPQGTPGLGIRLASIRVDNLIPFQVKKDFEEGGDQEKMIRNLAEQPAPLF